MPYLRDKGLIKIRKPYDNYLDVLVSQFKAGFEIPATSLDDNGSARYLGKIAKKIGALTIYRATNGHKKRIITMSGKIKRVQKSSDGTWYDLVGEVSLY
jgi:hypothetical protein